MGDGGAAAGDGTVGGDTSVTGVGDEGESATAAAADAAAAAAAVGGTDISFVAGPAAETLAPTPVAVPEAKPKAEGKRRQPRRRSLLSEEEGGLLSQAPAYRRSLLGY
jgi:hypothetical protein